MLLPFKDKTPVLGNNVYIAEGAIVIGDVTIGDESSVWFNCVIRGDVDRIRIGHHTNIQDLTMLHVTGGRFVLNIGDYVTMGHRVIAHGCTIGDKCLIGMGSVLLDGAVIGDQAVVAAGSVVPEGMIVPPRMLVAGVPAKIKRPVSDQELARMDEGWSHYCELKDIYLKERAED
ncbi:MAG: gamma carbonic anhydrase family protein [Blastocatellia bacterium]|nr:gamma carbonic anhydrase family protein [Blastocatellia bacterium]